MQYAILLMQALHCCNNYVLYRMSHKEDQFSMTLVKQVWFCTCDRLLSVFQDQCHKHLLQVVCFVNSHSHLEQKKRLCVHVYICVPSQENLVTISNSVLYV